MRLTPSTRTLAAAAFVAAISSLSLPLAASADDATLVRSAATAPVEATCRENVAVIQQPNLDDIHVVGASDRVRFVNRATVAATDIAIRIDRGNETRVVHDRGTFAPGVAVTHSFSSGSQTSYVPQPASCSIVSVRFANGTAWTSDGRAVVGVK
ncbi:MAG: hypothetical protein NVSMB21_23050 [Vulcanimicrobiaceae bacterium]